MTSKAAFKRTNGRIHQLEKLPCAGFPQSTAIQSQDGITIQLSEATNSAPLLCCQATCDGRMGMLAKMTRHNAKSECLRLESGPNWWFGKGIPLIHLNSSLGTIVICRRSVGRRGVPIIFSCPNRLGFIFGANFMANSHKGEFQKGRVARMAFFQRQTAAGEIFLFCPDMSVSREVLRHHPKMSLD